MNISDIIKLIQKEVAVECDGIFGLATASAVLSALQQHPVENSVTPTPIKPSINPNNIQFDARSEAVLATLDPKAQPMFRKFLSLAKATAATFGCDYRFISGYRSWADQDALFNQGRKTPGPRVTNAPGGYSFHNFKTSADAGVFSGNIYLDGGTSAQQAKAHQVHQECAKHAASCGLLCGALWKSMPDEPHYQVNVGHDSPTDDDRAKFQEKGSIL